MLEAGLSEYDSAHGVHSGRKLDPLGGSSHSITDGELQQIIALSIESFKQTPVSFLRWRGQR